MAKISSKKYTSNSDNSPIYFDGLTKDSFVVDKKKTSFKIVDSFGRAVGHYALNKIVSFDLQGNSIIISSADEVPFTYVFVSASDAEEANNKLDNFINGIY